VPVEILPDNPSISKVRAIITTQWGKSGYRPIVVRAIENYFVDSALDNDADGFDIGFADPMGKFLDLFKRDAEIRVQLFGIGKQGTNFIVTGVADDAAYDDQGSITISGRDYSSLATDSTAPPKQYRKKTGWSIVADQAGDLGFPRLNLSHAGKRHNTIYTDGSESYWEFWYRLYRDDKQFLWCEPDGTLIGNNLNFSTHPTYYFGTPRRADSAQIKKNYIPVERIEIHKTTQKRLADVWVFGQKGANNGFLEQVSDPTTKLWLKKPRKIMFDSTASSTKKARQVAKEEIYEGKVGSIEFRITIADPGWMIRQNQGAILNIPEIGLYGNFFIVGTRIQCGENGFVQEIRLREKQYAISRRTPEDPVLTKTKAPGRESVITGLGQEIASTADMQEAWGMYFVKAAREHSGPWDFNLFLATLIGICAWETSFLNVREYHDNIKGPQWYPEPAAQDPQEAHRHGEDSTVAGRELWMNRFANAAGNPRNPFNGRGHNAEAGVGPMQLTSAGLKYDADDHFRKNFRNEYSGGRWHPEHNIWSAAKYLRNCLKHLVADSGRDQDIWMGVSAYNHGEGGASVGDDYSNHIKKLVLKSPGYLEAVTDAVKASREAVKAADDGVSDSSLDTTVGTDGLPTREQVAAFFNNFHHR